MRSVRAIRNSEFKYNSRGEAIIDYINPSFLKGIFLEIYKGQKVWQTYEFNNNKTNQTNLTYDNFKKEGCYFIWTEFHSTNPYEYIDCSIKKISIPDITDTGYRSSTLQSVSLELPDKEHNLHKYMIGLLSVHNEVIMDERNSTNAAWKKRDKNNKQQSLLLI